MLAYANPPDISDERQRADGYGLVRFDKKNRTITFECWPRFADAKDGDTAQFPGWPITIKVADNDGRKPAAWLPNLKFEGAENPVVQVLEETGLPLYTVRVSGSEFQPPVFAPGRYLVKVGQDRPDGMGFKDLVAGAKDAVGERTVKLG
jgi:hypothetical protein